MTKFGAFLFLLAAFSLDAQRILYDGAQDTRAQAAVTAAKESGSAVLLDSELRNLDILARQQVDLIERWQTIRMRADINRFSTWTQVRKHFQDTAASLKDSLDLAMEKNQVDAAVARVSQLENEINQQIAEAAAAACPTTDKTCAKRDMIEEILSHSGEAKEVTKFAASAKGNSAALQAINEAVAALEQVKVLYSVFKGVVAGAKAVDVSFSDLRPDPLKTQAWLVKAEAAHWKNLGIIAARERLEVGEAGNLLDLANATLRFGVAADTPDNIDEGMRSLAASKDFNRMRDQLLVLHYAAAVSARDKSASEVAELRRTLEARRYNIERRAIIAGESDQMLQAAAARLALYWKSGIKPKDVADLLFHIAGTVSLPVIAAK